MKRALFIFRRDLRLPDNRGLFAALKAADEVILSFIFTPEQIEKNPFRSARCLQFMIESLEELEQEISARGGRFYLFYGKPAEIVEKCIKKLHVEGVFVNYDYTPYSMRRDNQIKAVCKKHAVQFEAHHDLLLHPIEETLKPDGKPYTIFTPFFLHASKFAVDKPARNFESRFFHKTIDFSYDKSIYHRILPRRAAQARGGRKQALKILKNLSRFTKYAAERNMPAQNKTTHLSPHLKFTTCSIREVYWSMRQQLGPKSELIRALYWRDFFTLVSLHFPHIFQGAFRQKFNRLKWKNERKLFRLWCEGRTGFPIVDAGMRELCQTGFMHNRVRMIVASFLVKDLHLNWQWGEKFFAQHLIDYDPAVNNGNWQWCASTGCDAQPYFRIFNPWQQSKKFDPDCEYIKKWIPELKNVPVAAIHKWCLEKNQPLCKGYPKPILDHAKEAKATLQYYRRLAKN